VASKKRGTSCLADLCNLGTLLIDLFLTRIAPSLFSAGGCLSTVDTFDVLDAVMLTERVCNELTWLLRLS